MHSYPHHIGDYRRNTAHLSNEEDLAYRRLLEMYYDTEKPIPMETDWVARRLRVGSKSVVSVLGEFFEESDEGWKHRRCEQEIVDYRRKAETARENGRRGGRPKNPVGTQSEPDGIPDETGLKANQKPEPEPEPVLEVAKATLSGSPFPPCPHQEILKLYAKHLPQLPQPRVWEGARANHLKARWVQAAKPSSYSPGGYATHEEGLQWWDSFFEYVAGTKLSKGFESNGRTWRPDITWMLKAENFAKIIEQRYE